MQLAVDVEEVGEVAVLRASGELDLGSAPKLREVAVARLTDGHRRLVLDLGGVEFLDSVGLGIVVAILKRARSLGGDLAVVVTRAAVRRPFELTGLDTCLTLHADVGAAIAQARGAT